MSPALFLGWLAGALVIAGALGILEGWIMTIPGRPRKGRRDIY